MNKKDFIAGTLFSILWASASTATKVALGAAQPLVISGTRFAIGASLMLFFSHIIAGKALPKGKQWLQLAVYGLLNISIYLSLYIFAMQQVTASVGALTIAANPVFISFLSLIILHKPLSWRIVISIVICLSGIVIVAFPLMKDAHVTLAGLGLLTLSTVSYSLGTIYFSSKAWNGLHLLVINGWQTLFGLLFILPIMFFTFNNTANHFNRDFWTGTLWLALSVSIVSVALWIWLLKKDPVKAGLWLFLCPVFGIIIAALFMKDPISVYTITGVLFVLAGLAISYTERKNNPA